MGIKFCTENNNSNNNYKLVLEHGLKYNLREDSNSNKSDSPFM